MVPQELRIIEYPKLYEPRLLIGFSGWMNGGDVSTGTVKCILDKTGAGKIAEIESKGFYIYSFPGTMEITALFRPHTKIQEGLIKSYDKPSNEFFSSTRDNLIIFLGKEPNLKWEEYSNCIFALCEQFGVKMIYFIGSVAGLVPHTREPKLFCSVSNAKLGDKFKHYGISLTNYEGPASIVTYLTAECSKRNLSMISLVASIPAYVQGNNPKCIEAITRRLAGMLKLDLDLSDLQSVSDEFEKRISEVVQQQPDLAENIKKLEEDYDNEIFNHEMADIKRWLEDQGIRVD
jgi:proteasome assembly chaperone (PAC2) family protein